MQERSEIINFIEYCLKSMCFDTYQGTQYRYDAVPFYRYQDMEDYDIGFRLCKRV